MSVKEYDPKEVSIMFGAFSLSDGLAEDEFIRCEPESDTFSDKVGVDGEVTRTKSNDTRWNVTFRAMHTSNVNDILSALATVDRSTEGGGGTLSLFIRDRGGRALFVAEEAWIKRDPNLVRAREAGENEWMLRCANVTVFHGGS